MRLKKERLGLDAGKHLDSLLKIENLEIVDLSNSEYDNIFSFSQHIYFKNNAVVLRDIECILKGDEKAREKYIQSRNGFFIELK